MLDIELVNKTFGESGHTVASFARVLGFTPIKVENILSGKRTPTPNNVRSINKALGITCKPIVKEEL